jgi:hypothetical protein
MSFLVRILAGPPDRFPNPLIAAEPEFACRCGAHRDACRAALEQWRADFGDNPMRSADPGEQAVAALVSCIRVYDLLVKPEWDQFDLHRAAEHYLIALENEEFRSVMTGRLRQVELAMHAARRHLDVLRCRS